MRMYNHEDNTKSLNWLIQVAAQTTAHTTVDILLTSERMTDYNTH